MRAEGVRISHGSENKLFSCRFGPTHHRALQDARVILAARSA